MRKPRPRKTPLPSVNQIDWNGQKTINIYTRKGEEIKYCNCNSGLAGGIGAAD